MFVLAPAGAYVGQWLQSFDRVMEAVTSAHKAQN